MMGLFNGWFSKQDKKPSPSSEEEPQKVEDRHSELQAYIVIGVDKEGDNFVACNFHPDHTNQMAELMFLFYSGSLTEECMQSLAQACDSEAQMKYILKRAAVFLHAQKQENMRSENHPVVDPMEVFGGRKEANEFKG